jgi:cell division protein FtsQ
MQIKASIKKIFSIALWCAIGGAGLALLVAAINKKTNATCRSLNVQVNAGGRSLFLNEKDLLGLLEKEGVKDVSGKSMQRFDLRRIETALGRQPWIRDAQLYFDNNQVLHVRVTERQPVARIFTVSGGSCYMDSSGRQMPLGGSVPLKLPVFTGYPAGKTGSSAGSVLDEQIKTLSAFLNGDPFWSSAIEQVNITPARTFELIPLIGNQVIEFGDGHDYADKFRRLLIFYKQVMTKTGFEKYERVSLQYAGQVVATRRGGPVSRTDSLQALRNVLEIIRQARKIESDTGAVREMKPLERNQVTEQTLQGYNFPEENEDQPDLNRKH